MRCSVTFEVVGAPVLGYFLFLFLKLFLKIILGIYLEKICLSAEILLAWLNYVTVFLI